jgi:mRNA-degrading endonuclease RelE of RelBE toxin-antitoxin system
MLTEKVMVRFTPKTYKQLAALAKEDKRDLSSYVRILIEDTLLQREVNGEAGSERRNSA